MSDIYCVAVTLAKEEYLDAVKTALEEVVAPVRQEEGVLQYELYRDPTEPRRFVFFERWESHEAFQAHVNAPHVQEFVKKTEGMVEQSYFHELLKHK